MKPSYIYTLEDSRIPGQARYVGRTNYPRKRLNEHKRCRGTECHKIHWIRSVLSEGGDVIMDLIDERPSGEIQKAEEFWITYLKFLGAPLTNSTEKSWGVVEHSPEVLAKMA